VRRHTTLLWLSPRLASTAAAIALGWSLANAQQANLLTPPPVTAVGQPEIIQTALRPGRLAAARAAHAGGTAPAPTAPALPAPAAAPPASPPLVAMAPVSTPATPAADPFLTQLDLAIEVSSRRYLRANEHSPWQIFHGLLALQQNFQLVLANRKVNAIEWIATSEPRFDNQPLLMKTQFGGKFHPFTRPYAFEGHPAQFLALLSQSDLPVGYKFKVGNDHITIGDIINNTMKEVNTREEVTWVLWGLQHYLKPDTQWVNQHNEPWSIERLVQIETASPVVGAPCGGNHRLFALTRARDKHLKHGGKLAGNWLQADHKIRQHIELARSLQNYDGTFSAKFYETSGHTTDLNQRFNTTGHTMEFLSISLPDSRLNEQWVRNAVTALSNDLVVNRQRQIDCGPLYHTLNSLIIYRGRLRALQPSVTPPAAPQAQVAGQPAQPGTTSTPSLGGAPTPLVGAPKPLLETKPVSAKAGSTDKAVTLEPPMPLVASGPMPVKERPSEEALNELKLDDESRERLNALASPRTQPAALRPPGDSLPLEPVSTEADAPVSALKPENG